MQSFTNTRVALRKALSHLDTLEEQEKLDRAEGTYRDANHESFGRVPQTCPIIEEIVNRRVLEVIEWIRKHPKASFDTEEFIDELKTNITYPFRNALREALEQKYLAIELLAKVQNEVRDMLRTIRTVKKKEEASEIINISDGDEESD